MFKFIGLNAGIVVAHMNITILVA